MIHRYNSLRELVDAHDALPLSDRERGRKHDAWLQGRGRTLDQNRAACRDGDLSWMPKAEALLSKLSPQVEVEVPVYHPAPVGARPHVPNAVLGVPDSMYRRVVDATTTSPVRIVAFLTSSACYSEEEVESRGIAILALAVALSRVRPVSLQIAVTLACEDAKSEEDRKQGSLTLVNVDLNATCLSEACPALACVGVARALCFNIARNDGFMYGWAPWVRFSGDRLTDESLARAKQEFGLDDQDLIIPPIYAGDPLMKDPIKWINERVALYQNQLVEA